jgi:hypothetical protein
MNREESEPLREPRTSMNFTDRLKTLPATHHLAALQLLDAQGAVLATIENRPGQAGSLAVYAALAAQHGGQITPEAAALGLTWYAEHTADAHANPGKHPNIDRLMAWAQGSVSHGVRHVMATND